jgi:tRNA (cytidine56-2'-O)-methyltransferase
MSVIILRLGHRFHRDARISTHLALTARALGADAIVYDVADSSVKQSVDEITSAWGGGFRVESTESWRSYIRDFAGERVHLTMYGLPLDEVVPKIGLSRDVLVVLGGAKVPSDVYQMVDYNVSVGNQPHSEVAALAVFLDRLFAGVELTKEFNGRLRIVPQERGKKVVE